MLHEPYPQVRTTKGRARLTWQRGRKHRYYSCREAAAHVLRKLKARGPFKSAADIELALADIGVA